jgi:hypothetical protein
VIDDDYRKRRYPSRQGNALCKIQGHFLQEFS